MSDIVATVWFVTESTVGFVLIYDEYMGFKCYVGGFSFGYTSTKEQDDTEWIRKHGAKVDVKVAFAIFGKRMASELIRRRIASVAAKSLKYDGVDWHINTEFKEVSK